MTKLSEHTIKIRSKNAGPFWLTIDIFCDGPEAFTKTCQIADNHLRRISHLRLRSRISKMVVQSLLPEIQNRQQQTAKSDATLQLEVTPRSRSNCVVRLNRNAMCRAMILWSAATASGICSSAASSCCMSIWCSVTSPFAMTSADRTSPA